MEKTINLELNHPLTSHIPINSNSTPTRGRELTILQQLFGNLGRLGAGNLPGN